MRLVLLSSWTWFRTHHGPNGTGRGGRTAAFKFYELRDNLFRNVQIVYAPDHALPEIVQRESRSLPSAEQHRLGRNTSLQRLVASGPRRGPIPAIPRSRRCVAGGISLPG